MVSLSLILYISAIHSLEKSVFSLRRYWRVLSEPRPTRFSRQHPAKKTSHFVFFNIVNFFWYNLDTSYQLKQTHRTACQEGIFRFQFKRFRKFSLFVASVHIFFFWTASHQRERPTYENQHVFVLVWIFLCLFKFPIWLVEMVSGKAFWFHIWKYLRCFDNIFLFFVNSVPTYNLSDISKWIDICSCVGPGVMMKTKVSANQTLRAKTVFCNRIKKKLLQYATNVVFVLACCSETFFWCIVVLLWNYKMGPYQSISHKYS